MSLNCPALLLALGMLESGNDDLAVGDHGKSRGRYQISSVAWRSVTAMPWKAAHIPAQADRVAKGILDARIMVFRATLLRAPTPQQVYILWNAPSQVNKPSRKVRERAERFANLYDKYCKEGR